MIDWKKTYSIFGYHNYQLPPVGSRPKVVVICNLCNYEGEVAIRTKNDVGKFEHEWKCRACCAKDPNRRSKISKATKNNWKDDEYRATIKKAMENRGTEYSDKMSEISKELWKDSEYRKKTISFGRKVEDETKQKISSKMKEAWESDKFGTVSEASRKQMLKQWQDPAYREKMVSSLNESRDKCKKVSNIQGILYSILDDLGVKYHREYNDKKDDVECKVGPYSFDCVIPREGDRDLLIECQGDFWHSLEHKIRQDKSKSTYVNKYLSDTYEIKYLWEHEFSNHNRVLETIKYWLDLSKFDLIDFDFKDIEIKKSEAKEYKLLLSKYHYLSNAGRGGIAYGAYLKDMLTAICVFSHLPRHNIKIDDYTQDETRELSRLCVHPKYQKKNFTSWFVSRCIKNLPDKFKCVVSYCDTTFNHDGAIYKACNFKLNGEVKPDYWYVAENGWVMHKKTLYDHAVKMSMTERKYADKYGYTRIYGDKKLRFVFIR